jgi:hypothetical protein
VYGAWTAHPDSEAVQTSFNIPGDADLVYIFKRGALGDGSLHLTQSTEPGDSIHVRVVVRYNSDDVLAAADVCLFTRGENQHGIGIFVRFPFAPFAYVAHGTVDSRALAAL